ncbi:MAG: hypothetical protein KAF42_03560, partial [Sphingopyxis terrae]|nr:hypothetical protein [Sphingopyxis terrae]
MAGLVLALLLAAAGEPAIRVEKLAAGGFSADVADIEAARLTTTMEEVQRIAAQRCGKMKVRFGRYNFDSRVDTTRNVMMIENLRQKFFCYDPATDPYKPVPADWKASDADTAAATSFVTRFLDRLDRGDQARIAMMDPLAEITPKDSGKPACRRPAGPDRQRDDGAAIRPVEPKSRRRRLSRP